MIKTKLLRYLVTRYTGRKTLTLLVGPDPVVAGVLALKAEVEGLSAPLCFLLRGEPRVDNLEEVEFNVEPRWVEA